MELYDNFSEKSKMILDQAFTEARAMNMNYVGTEHLLLSLLKIKSDIIDQVKRYNQLSYKDVKKECLRFVGIGLVQREIQGYSRRASEIIKLSGFEANSLKSLKVEPVHILLSLLDNQEATAVKVLEKIGISAFDIKTDIIKELDLQDKKKAKDKQKHIESSFLEKYGVDMTKLAKENKFDPLIARESEVNRLVQILGRRTKNNPCLIGEPGVGKTAVVEGVSQLMHTKKVPDYLYNKKIISVSLGALLAGSKFRGEFEDRLTQLIEEVQGKKNIILFIDEIHTLVGAGATQGAMDAANILKPFLSRDDIQIIGATTISEYRKYIEKDLALERRLQPVVVKEPSVEVCIDILNGIKKGYEDYHQVTITEKAITAAVKLSHKYISDRFLPDKAIDLIDEAASRVRIDGLELLDDNKILEVISLWTGIPVRKLTTSESNKLLSLEKSLKNRVVGQELAINTVSKAIRRARVGLNNADRPIGSFIFLGSTGVGKTELAKALAEELFGNEKDLIRIDMSEYMEKHSVSKIIGSPPGYVAYEEGGQLTEKVRLNPFSVILFDELEKAHPDVVNLLFQLLDEGELTDGKGRKVNFKNTIVIFTSNVGVESIKKKTEIGFVNTKLTSDDFIEFEEQLKFELKKEYKVEFLNRIDEIVVFKSLNKEEIYEIIDKLLELLATRVNDLEYVMEVDSSIKSKIYEIGYSNEYGVRSIKRAITRIVENELSEYLLKNEPAKNTKLKIYLDEEGNVKIVETC